MLCAKPGTSIAAAWVMLGLLLVKYRPLDLHSCNLLSTAVKQGEKKERPVFVALCSPPVSWVVRLVARQRNRHRRDQHKPPVRVCNVGIAAPAEMHLNV
ncbi:hypothetical protein PBY51_015321 [Eleginops maclovinus]|uniref:Uncharacterized protein n=1 Tax=Eleginops maclovinus TaxID=56733 RepID=A0AAN8ABU8_ELEMC|nr:hypothetical protein PBY51_015321 [Eleginops maclovinus]